MIAVGCFSEMKCFADNGSIKDFIVDNVGYDKNKVVDYLSSQKKVASCPRESIDCVTGKVIKTGFTVYNDGEFEWCDFLIYHIKKYNIKLPQRLIEKINAS